MTHDLADLLVIAKIGAPHGVRGDLVLHVFMEDPELILDFQEAKTPLFIQNLNSEPSGLAEPYKISEKGGRFYISFEHYLDRDLARRFVNKEISVSKKYLPAPEENEVYWVDLIGLSVINQEGKTLGQVDHVFETGANDVLVLRKIKQPDLELSPDLSPEPSLERSPALSKKIKIPKESTEILIPYVSAHVLSVDLKARKILVNWDENF